MMDSGFGVSLKAFLLNVHLAFLLHQITCASGLILLAPAVKWSADLMVDLEGKS